jgi:putative endonuclease
MGEWIAKIWKVVDCLLHGQLSQVFAHAEGSGWRAERLAESLLRRNGGRILARNVRCRGGEIDLIALHKGTILFVEVRLRQHREFGGAAASITPTKQRRLVLAARYWLADAGQMYCQRRCRFDAIVFDGLDAQHARWLEGVFGADGF